MTRSSGPRYLTKALGSGNVPLKGLQIVNAVAAMWRFIGQTFAGNRCVGCGTAPGKGKPVVGGPGVSLCRHCFDDAFVALKSNRQEIVPVRGSNLRSTHCHFCGNRSGDRGGLATWPKGAICADCLLLCDEILVEQGF